MGFFDDQDLSDLRWHWRGAYIVNGGNDRWVATRTDTGRSLFAGTADGLLDKIRADYRLAPVPRPPRTYASPDRVIRKFGA
jgi:hypothetical protein